MNYLYRNGYLELGGVCFKIQSKIGLVKGGILEAGWFISMHILTMAHIVLPQPLTFGCVWVMSNLQRLDRLCFLAVTQYFSCVSSSPEAWSSTVLLHGRPLASFSFFFYFSGCFLLIGLRNEFFGTALFVGKTAVYNVDSV